MEQRHKNQASQQTWIQLRAGNFQSHGSRQKQGHGLQKQIVGRTIVYFVPRCVQLWNVVIACLDLYVKVVKTLMGFPLYLYSKPIQYISFPIIVCPYPQLPRISPSICICFHVWCSFFCSMMHFRPILVPYMGFHVVITPPNLKSKSLNSLKFIQKSPINEYSVQGTTPNFKNNLIQYLKQYLKFNLEMNFGSNLFQLYLVQCNSIKWKYASGVPSIHLHTFQHIIQVEQ